MLLLQATQVEKSFGNRHVLRGCSLTVSSGDRVGLVGINGSGKSTFLQIVAGLQEPDHGTVYVRREPGQEGAGGLGLLGQDPLIPGDDVGQALDEAVRWHGRLVHAWERAMEAEDLDRAGPLQDRLDRHGWDLGHRVEAMADRLGVAPRRARVASLSGGERRRLALTRVLLGAPDLLLLDEPTNHLDADTIEWLQDWILAWGGALVLVTHDRYMLEAVATRIVEVEDGITVAYEGAYADYLISRAERQASLRKTEDRRLALIAREAEWASRSPAAQMTQQKARLQRLDALMKARPLKKEETFDLDLRTGFKKGGPLVELQGVKKAWGNRTILAGLDYVLRPGERIGVLGPNGIGKSTLLHIVSGSVTADKGNVTRAPRINPAVLDQQRSGLEPTDTVFEAAGNGNDHVRLGDRDVHVASFLGRFLFHRLSLDQRVSSLSGGERARLLLAKLLLRGANLLLLDEPTNDLDLLTLEVLEEALLSFDGAVMVVSHDRAFLDRVCTAVLTFEGDGKVTAYASRSQSVAAQNARKSAPAGGGGRKAPPTAPPPKETAKEARARLSFKEQQEHVALPARIEGLEAELAALEARLADRATYKGGVDLGPLTARAQALPPEIEAMWARWGELEARANATR
jgi:ATP-binding cassette subfamily F protein uup